MTPASHTPPEYGRAAVLLFFSSLVFATVGAIIKILSESVAPTTLVFFRASIGLLALTPLLVRGGLADLATEHFRSHVARAFAGLAAMYCFFYAIAHLPLAEATLLNYSSPLFIPFIARVWIGEPVPAKIGRALVTGMVGIAIILRPGLGFFTPAALVGVLSAGLTATAMVSIRGLARHEPTTRIVFYFGLVTSLASAVPLLWTWETPARSLWPLIGLMGVLACCGQLLLTRAYALAPAARVGPFTYMTVVFAAFFGWLVWDEVPDAWSALGAVLVFAAGFLAIRALEPRAEEAPEEAIPESSV